MNRSCNYLKQIKSFVTVYFFFTVTFDEFNTCWKKYQFLIKHYTNVRLAYNALKCCLLRQKDTPANVVQVFEWDLWWQPCLSLPCTGQEINLTWWTHIYGLATLSAQNIVRAHTTGGRHSLVINLNHKPFSDSLAVMVSSALNIFTLITCHCLFSVPKINKSYFFI